MCESQRNQTIADVCQEEEKPYVLQSVTGAYESSIDPTRACSRRSPPDSDDLALFREMNQNVRTLVRTGYCR